LIYILFKIVKRTYGDHTNLTYKSQKFQPRMLLEIIGRVLKEGISWRSIDTFYGYDSTYPNGTLFMRST